MLILYSADVPHLRCFMYNSCTDGGLIERKVSAAYKIPHLFELSRGPDL